MKNLKEEFDKFLKKHRIYRKYYRNSDFTVSWIVNNVIKWNEEDRLISSTFVWESSPEGYDFWSHISDLWKKYYKEIQ